jgi:hypothetical protein
LSPRKEKERDPFAPKKINSKKPPVKKIAKPDRVGHGGGNIFHSNTVDPFEESNKMVDGMKRVDGIKRQLKGSERERELRQKFKSFAPVRPTPKLVEESPPPPVEVVESRAFDAKRVRGIGFDPRRRVGDDDVRNDRKIAPIVGQRVSLEGVLGGMASKQVEMDSDSDSDLDIVMA